MTSDQPLPRRWSDHPCFIVDEATLADPERAAATAAELREAWLSRTRMVVRLGVDPQVLKA
ncbi:MAG: hypothetical protein M3O70_20860, partial [Actinomycetota bacterium]|nr:hypothetical protein [Actinomycetota bacterium]